MMENVYLQEAFKALDILNEEDFNLTSIDGFEDAKEFIDKDEKSDFVDIIDPEATTEEELKDSYIGDVILDCCVCHSKLYKHPEEVHLDEEEGLANMDEECPFCYSTDGYTIIGQVAPFEKEEEEKEEIDNEVEIEDKIEVEDEVEESLKEGILGTGIGAAGGAALGAAALGPLGALGGAALGGLAGNVLTKTEELEEDADISEYQKWVDFDMEKYGKISNLTMRKIKKAGFSVVKDQYGEYEVIADRKDESLLNETTETDAVLDETTWRKLPLAVQDRLESYWNAEANNKVFKPYLTALEDTGVLTSSEVIAILKSNIEDGYATTIDESCEKKPVREHFEKVEIETDKEKMEMTAEENGKVVVITEPKKDEEEVIAPVSDEVQTEINDVVETEDNDYEDIDIDEFSEEEFNELGEAYLKKVYENVNSFKTSKVKETNDKLVVEGIIGFASGKEKKTSFIFESKDISKKGKVRFIGENLQLSRGKKAFTITGSINKGRFIAESLNYNYRTKDSEGKSTRLYGTVRTKK